MSWIWAQLHRAFQRQEIKLEVVRQNTTSLYMCANKCACPGWFRDAGDGFNLLHKVASWGQPLYSICLLSSGASHRTGRRTPPFSFPKDGKWVWLMLSLANSLLPSITPWQPGPVLQPLPWRDRDQAFWGGRAQGQGIYTPQGSLLPSLLFCTATTPPNACCP
jgi:hypothetical protein